MNGWGRVFLGALLLTSSALAESSKPVSKPETPVGICCIPPSGHAPLLRREKMSPQDKEATLATVALTFEGLQDTEALANFYNGGLGGSGSGPGPNFGITFSANSLALIDSDAGGSGNFGGEPSPSTILFFNAGSAATMNVPAGFQTGFSFFYAAPFFTGTITVYDGLNATGNVLATLPLGLTPNNGAPDPTGQYSPLVPVGVSFPGTAMSVDFGGTAAFIGFDNITLGSATPEGAAVVPTLSPWGIAALAAALALVAIRLLRA
jgi:hypothetical protein